MKNFWGIIAALLLGNISGCAWYVSGDCRDECGESVGDADAIGCGYEDAYAKAQDDCRSGSTLVVEDDGPVYAFCGNLRLRPSVAIAKSGELARDLWGMTMRHRTKPQNSGSCPTGDIFLTLKIVNNNFGCFEGGPTYFRWTYSTADGESSMTQAVGAGESVTLPITAFDADLDGVADKMLVDYSGSSDLDPNICSSGSLEQGLRNNQTWTLTMNEDGSITESVTTTGNRTPATKAAPAPAPALKPIPDPRFTPRPSK